MSSLLCVGSFFIGLEKTNCFIFYIFLHVFTIPRFASGADLKFSLLAKPLLGFVFV